MNQTIRDQFARAREQLAGNRPLDTLSMLDPLIAAAEEDGFAQDLQAELFELAGQAALAAGNYIKAQEHLRQAAELLDVLRERRRLLANQLGQAECALRQGNLPKARHICTTSLLVATENGWDEHQAGALLCLGNIAWAEGDMEAAEDYLVRALKGFEKLGQLENANRARCSLGIAKDIAGRSEEAMSLLHQALEFFRNVQDFTQVVRCLNNLAGVTYSKRDYSRSREYLLQCVELETEIQNQGDLAPTWYNLGLIETYSGDFKLARKYLNRAFQIAQHMGQRASQGSALLQLAVVSLKEDRPEEALNYAELAAARFEGSSSAHAVLLQYYLPVFLLASGQNERACAKWASKSKGGGAEQLQALIGLLVQLEEKALAASIGNPSEIVVIARRWCHELSLELENAGN